MRVADNHKGYNVEVFSPFGWTPVTSTPFSTLWAAEQTLSLLRGGVLEYRIYEAV